MFRRKNLQHETFPGANESLLADLDTVAGCNDAYINHAHEQTVVNNALQANNG